MTIRAQLGMPLGTASARLRKMIMFELAKKASMDVCYRCKKQIVHIADFSIEHKQPWRNVSTSLFWDLNNIAFSHHKCNVSAARKHRPSDQIIAALASASAKNGVRRKAPKGTAWCAKHRAYIHQSKFSKDKYQIGGFRIYCKDCRNNKPLRTSVR